jgi:very-short-patch-repair endonuclease
MAEEIDRRARSDACIARRAAEEWSVLSLDELRDCGLSPDQVTHRLRKGWLHRVYPAVYAVGHSGLSMEGRFLAAVKSVGGRAFLSRFSAAALWEFVKWDGRYPDVLVVRAGIKPRSGIRVHRASVLDRRDVMRHNGIPVTSPARTLVDLAAVANDKLLRTAVRRALARRRVSIPWLVATRRRLGPRRGAARLDRVLQNAAPTRSELEDVVFDLIVDAGFVRPEVNRAVLLAGRRVVPDFRWPEQRIVVEADSRTWHDNPIARADDAERQTLLEARGDRVLRVTWTQAISKPRDTVARIEAAGVPRGRAALGAVA